METNKIYQGDCLDVLKTFPDESIDCVMTSPPYWALRDYGESVKSIWDGDKNCEHDFTMQERKLHGGTIDLSKTIHSALINGGLQTNWITKDGFCSKCNAWKGQLGLEPTFDLYIKHLCDIFDEIKRVLKKSGTCWVNLGDSYFGSGKGAGGDIKNSKQVWTFENKTTKNCQNCGKEFEGYAFQQFCASSCSGVDNTPRNVKDAIEWKRKGREEYNKVGITKSCLYCEKEINGKPNSQFCSRTCLNKLGNKFRGQRRELPDKTLTMIPFRFAIDMVNRGWILRNNIIWHKPNCMPSSVKDRFTVDFEYLFFFTKNKKYFFETQYEPLAESSFNDKRKDNGLVKHKTGKSIKGSPYAINGTSISSIGRNKRAVWKIPPKPFKEAHFAVFPEALCETPIKAGCQIGGIVLDPFFGSGTTGLVALKENRQFIGIEQNPDYIKIAEARLKPYLEQTKLNIRPEKPQPR